MCLRAYKRSVRDSNPRAVSSKRFSRPPRYDRFDNAACKICMTCRFSTTDHTIPYDFVYFNGNFSNSGFFLQETLGNIQIFRRSDLYIKVISLEYMHVAVAHLLQNHGVIGDSILIKDL